MNNYIIEVHPFPPIIGSDKLIRVESEKHLDSILEVLESKLEKENPMFEYDLIGYTMEDFLSKIQLIKI